MDGSPSALRIAHCARLHPQLPGTGAGFTLPLPAFCVVGGPRISKSARKGRHTAFLYKDHLKKRSNVKIPIKIPPSKRGEHAPKFRNERASAIYSTTIADKSRLEPAVPRIYCSHPKGAPSMFPALPTAAVITLFNRRPRIRRQKDILAYHVSVKPSAHRRCCVPGRCAACGASLRKASGWRASLQEPFPEDRKRHLMRHLRCQRKALARKPFSGVLTTHGKTTHKYPQQRGKCAILFVPARSKMIVRDV
jgi:hypothetical protein